jgi:branched-chain amino acid transport system ATP-binding protein
MAARVLMMIDEMSLGLAAVVVDSLTAALQNVRRQGMSILLVEQDGELALSMADRACVLETGRASCTADRCKR